MALRGTALLEVSAFTASVYPPLANSNVESGDVESGEQALANRTLYLNDTKVAKAGDTMTGALILNAGATVASGQTLTINGSTLAGSFTVTGVPTLTGRRVIPRPRVTVTDASQTLDVTQGDTFELPANNVAPRVITLKNTAPAVPEDGECMTFLWTPGNAGGAGIQYTFQREDTTVVATFDGSAVANTGAVFAEFEYAAGVWRLRTSSGSPWDGAANYGVTPGAGA